ncbi:MAG: hypothetical protein ACT4QG_00775 [Sporichthyaceae bacterium]
MSGPRRAVDRLNRILDEGLGPFWGTVVFGGLLLVIVGLGAAFLFHAVPDLGIE